MQDKILDIAGTTDKLALLLSGGDVRRYHQEGSMRQQPISEHTWRLLVILLHFWPQASRKLLITALYHDVAERFTGDVPATVKLNSPEANSALDAMEKSYHQHLDIPHDAELDLFDLARLKVSDYLELCITCCCQSGRRATQVFNRGLELVHTYASRLPAEERIKILEFVGALETGAWNA